MEGLINIINEFAPFPQEHDPVARAKDIDNFCVRKEKIRIK